ncbi:hypothetical protein QJS04_geneDACA022143 [Acorus gramineus]|uniref:Uncharacterized protein n=1 Tax=Acorus gramineus TaxID=55184 RepID=A0AAV9BL81_ACOGR|nr:hypothetical protein QJS04_geneDACA022143 [Acorus gramineus]
MGRELKCPICLSLLNSAVSLTCNHMFCGPCISQSMKSVSNCPVCKVPYHRREVRPAPHMDNLVSIYRGMESAAGVNIFTTQTVVSKKSDEHIQDEPERGKNLIQEKVKAGHRKAKKRKSGKQRKESTNDDGKISYSQSSMEPSCPTKKRVHVTLYPPIETPLRPEKFPKLAGPTNEKSVGGTSYNVPEDGSNALKEKIVVNDEGEPIFSPFFWLREEEEDESDGTLEKLSSQQTLDTPSHHKIPCFSDMKDSDDDSSVKSTQIGEAQSKAEGVGGFDSEIFYWTQRACSPEIYLTPTKKAADKVPLHNIQENDGEAIAQSPMLISEEIVNSEIKKSSGEAENDRAISATHTIITGGQRPKTRVKRIRLGRPLEENSNKGKASVCGRKGIVGKAPNNKTTRKDDTGIANGIPESDLDGVLLVAPCDSTKAAENLDHKDHENTLLSARKNAKRCKKINQNIQRKRVKILTDPVVDSETKIRQVITEIKGNEEMGKELTPLSCNEPGNSRMGKKTNSRRKHEKSSIDDYDQDVGHPATEHVNVQLPVLSSQRRKKEIKINSGNKSGRSRTKGQKFKSLENVSVNVPRSDGTALDNSTKVQDHVLRKCKSIPDQAHCSFCQSNEDTEVSGEMIHYFNGNPVASNHNGGANVIHSHKNCTEWAPNVYFENECALNLSAELTRSKKIKCCCCGIKGAALGCYEKSCRKSFHYTCARLIKQCRWDEENFVMLCPLHSSSKLPNEVPKAEKQTRKKSALKRENREHVVAKPGPDPSKRWKWPLGVSCKWVLCCSGLNHAEKEIILEFIKLTGISVAKTWTPTTTHVIASTDENGAYGRTIKTLMAVLEGKWILNIDWIKACMKVMTMVDEEQYEIKVDRHGIKDGPRLGRLRIINKEPKLFSTLEFYFIGDFKPSYKSYLQELVITGGGTILYRKPISMYQGRLPNRSSSCKTIIVYSLEPPENSDASQISSILDCRRSDAQSLANATGAKVAGHSWILDSAAGCKLQRFD